MVAAFINQKRDAERILDALGTDELGQLPDKNLGEWLNRVPGVTMLVEKGEGRYVQLRGIRPELNNVTLNGMALGSPEAEGGGRVAGFAHYGKRGGEPFKDKAYGAVVTYDQDWRRWGVSAFPRELSERMAPYAASGGAIGPDGLLYVLGHDLPAQN